MNYGFYQILNSMIFIMATDLKDCSLIQMYKGESKSIGTFSSTAKKKTDYSIILCRELPCTPPSFVYIAHIGPAASLCRAYTS